jgi:hypothetical protein
MSSSFRVAWYRFRATFARHWPGYLAIVLLIGLVGGQAMGDTAAYYPARARAIEHLPHVRVGETVVGFDAIPDP